MKVGTTWVWHKRFNQMSWYVLDESLIDLNIAYNYWWFSLFHFVFEWQQPQNAENMSQEEYTPKNLIRHSSSLNCDLNWKMNCCFFYEYLMWSIDSTTNSSPIIFECVSLYEIKEHCTWYVDRGSHFHIQTRVVRKRRRQSRSNIWFRWIWRNSQWSWSRRRLSLSKRVSDK